jgi:hypothetical protein
MQSHALRYAPFSSIRASNCTLSVDGSIIPG